MKRVVTSKMNIPLSRLLIVGCAVNILWACASTPPTYDSNATETLVRITDKRLFAQHVQGDADKVGMQYMPIYGVVGAVITNMLTKKQTINLYLYTVKTPSGRQVMVESEYPSFAIGDCMKVLESSQPNYPRLIRAQGCE